MRDRTQGGFDPYLTAILASRVDGVIREMSNTLLRSARSGVINSARDFSCTLCTSDNRLLAAVEGLPIHIFGSQLQSRAMCDVAGDDLRPGDCFLHNDPHSGNTHAADHTFLAPVFIEGEHMFTAVAKAHQADVGNCVPTTYVPDARDQYEEGALIFPAVRVQRDYRMIEDIVRMCRARIRVPDQWYGDFLAGIGAVRIAEKRLVELCTRYGKETIRSFINDWFAYSGQRMVQAVRRLPRARLHSSGAHDPFTGILPDGIALKVSIRIEPDEGYVEVDLTDNGDAVESGFNVSRACASAAAVAGVLNVIDSTVPRNSGSMERVRVKLREGSICGGPQFPRSCSVATTNVSARLINMIQAAFADLGDGFGLAEGGVGMGAGCAVVSGNDARAGNAPYVNQLFICGSSGPGTPMADGWVTYGIPVAAGLPFLDSIEVDELKQPIRIRHVRLLKGSGGAGKFRGAPAFEVSYGPTVQPMTVLWPCDGTRIAPRGVRGGEDGAQCAHWKVGVDGRESELEGVVALTLQPGESIRGHQGSGGGYGDPLERDPLRVLNDVLEGYETSERAREAYGIVFRDDPGSGMEVDGPASADLRARMRRARADVAGSR